MIMEEKIEKLGTPLKATFILHSVGGRENGRDVLYFSMFCLPSVLIVYDVNEKKVIKTVKHKETTPLLACWSHHKDRNGNIYMADFGENAGILKYTPGTGDIENLFTVEGEVAAYHLCEDGEGKLYFGTALNGKLISYNPETGEATDYGTLFENEKYICSGAVHGDYYYGGTRSENPLFFRWHLKNKTAEIIPLPSCVSGDANAVYYMTARGKYIFADIKMNSEEYVIICYNTETEKWEDFTEKSLGGQHISEELEGKTYFVSEDGRLLSICMDTLGVSDTGIVYYRLKKGDDGFDYANGLMGGAFFRLDDQKKYPGYTYITTNYDNNAVAYINLERKTVEFVNEGLPRGPVKIKALHNTYDGRIVMGGYMGTCGCIYNPEDGSIEEFFLRQTEGMTLAGKKNYFGVYTRATVWEFDPAMEYERDKNPREIFGIENHQDRPFALCEWEGNLIIGSIPDYHKLGGALTVHNIKTGKTEVFDNLIENQSITGLCVRNGIVYGSTGIWGGLSATPTEKRAKLFSFNIEKRELIKVCEPELGSPEKPVLHIGGMTVDSKGNIWAVSSGIVFQVNPETLEAENVIDIYGNNIGMENVTWKPFSIIESGDFIYANPDEKLVRINSSTLEVKKYNESAFMLTANSDGNIYFCYDDEFSRLVTSKEQHE